MEFTAKEYCIIKAKRYFQSSNLFIFFNGANRLSHDWVIVEQKLKKTNFYYYKVYNKTSKKALQNSIYLTVSSLINGVTFLFHPIEISAELIKNDIIKNFEPLFFTLLALKVNNKIYSKSQLKNIFSFNYEENKLLLLQFNIVQIKSSYFLTKKYKLKF